MNKYYVTTSRGWLAKVTDTAEMAYAACRKLRETNGINYKVIKPTPWRLVLGNPVALSIPLRLISLLKMGWLILFYDNPIMKLMRRIIQLLGCVRILKLKGALDTTWLAGMARVEPLYNKKERH